MQGAADRIASVIDHMRMLIRESGDVEVGPVDLNLAVKRSLTLMSAKLAYHGIRLKLDLAPAEAMVLANGIQLEQVIINLMANAIDIHDTHERRDKLVNISTTPDGDHFSLVVEDNGHRICKRTGEDIRAVLHDQEAGRKHGARPCAGADLRQVVGW